MSYVLNQDFYISQDKCNSILLDTNSEQQTVV